MSDKTKRKLSKSRRLAATGAPRLPEFPVDMPYETAREIFDRDRGRCRGCHEPHLKLVMISERPKKFARRVDTKQRMEITALVPNPGLENVDDHALMCAACRSNVLPFISREELPPPWKP